MTIASIGPGPRVGGGGQLPPTPPLTIQVDAMHADLQSYSQFHVS